MSDYEPSEAEVEAAITVLHTMRPATTAREDWRYVARSALVAARAVAEDTPPEPLPDVAYFTKRVDEWREMPILGHGLYARYQDAQDLLVEAVKLVQPAARASAVGDVSPAAREAIVAPRDLGEFRCAECALGHHSRCSGDFSPNPPFVTCWCGFCRSWVNEHGPFASVPDESRVEELSDG